MVDNLDIAQINGNQDQKEVTANLATSELMQALTEVFPVDMSAGDVTLTTLQFQRAICFACSGQAASQEMEIPDVRRGIFVVQNEDASFPVVVTHGSSSVSIDPLNGAIFKTDGSANDLVKIADTSVAGTIPYDIMLNKLGVPANAELITRAVFARSVTFPAGLGSSVADAGTASTGNVSFDIQKNGISKGSVVFNASSTGTFTFPADVTYIAGDILELVAPATADGTLADISITLSGTR